MQIFHMVQMFIFLWAHCLNGKIKIANISTSELLSSKMALYKKTGINLGKPLFSASSAAKQIINAPYKEQREEIGFVIFC